MEGAAPAAPAVTSSSDRGRAGARPSNAARLATAVLHRPPTAHNTPMVAVNSTMLPLGTPAPDFRLAGHGGQTRRPRRLSRRAGPAGDVHLQSLPVREAHPRRAGARSRATTSARGRGDGRHQQQRRQRLSRRSAGEDGRRSAGARATSSRTCTTRRRRWRAPIAPPARRTSSSSTASAGWSIAASSTTAGRAASGRSPAPTCAPPPTRCSPAPRRAREQRPSIGCNIKWKTGAAPDYFPR